MYKKLLYINEQESLIWQVILSFWTTVSVLHCVGIKKPVWDLAFLFFSLLFLCHLLLPFLYLTPFCLSSLFIPLPFLISYLCAPPFPISQSIFFFPLISLLLRVASDGQHNGPQLPPHQHYHCQICTHTHTHTHTHTPTYPPTYTQIWTMLRTNQSTIIDLLYCPNLH